MRVFIAVSLNSAFRREISRLSETMASMTTGRFVTPDMYHITLAFPGERTADELPVIKEAICETASVSAPFPIILGKPGYFGKADNAIAICGVLCDAHLPILADTVRANLTRRGVTFDPKPFRAHVTLGRHVRMNADTLALTTDPVEYIVSELTLYHSARVNGILTYTPVYSAPMAKGVQ